MRALFKLVLLAVIACISFFGGIGWWIGDGDPPTKSDLIVVLSGAYSRPFYAATLFAEGMGQEVWISQPKPNRAQRLIEELGVLHPREQVIQTAILAKRGVPVSKIKLYGPDVDSTVDEAVALRRQLGDTGKKLLVVTSSYHVRRSRIILSHYLPHAVLRVVATPYEDVDALWWRRKELAEKSIVEPFKLGMYLLKWAAGRLPEPPMAEPASEPPFDMPAQAGIQDPKALGPGLPSGEENRPPLGTRRWLRQVRRGDGSHLK